MLRQISSIPVSRPTIVSPDANPVTVSRRAYTRTALEDFTFDHLRDPAHIKRLQHALDTAKRFKETGKAAGASFVVTGSYGTGKTTIAENLMNLFRSQVVAVDYDAGAIVYDERTRRTVIDGKLLDANQLVAAVEDRRGGLHSMFGSCRAVVIDDVGSESFATPTWTPTAEQDRNRRHSAYGQFFDYAYTRAQRYTSACPLHVIVTSNIPIVVNGAINEEFIDKLGGKAFSRLLQMASGYMCDLTGLPDYRQSVVLRRMLQA
jgi:hypothetical protein